MSEYELASQIHKPAYQDVEDTENKNLALMVAEFSHYYHMSILDVYQMPSQMFFIYYKQLIYITAGEMITNIHSLNLAKAMQYGDKKDKRKIEREFNKLLSLSRGKT